MAEKSDSNIFGVVHKSEGRSRDKSGTITIETATKGLMYRTNVYLNGFLIDAKEVSCIDLATLENGQSVFKQRYLSTHKAFEQQYFMEKVFAKVLTTAGQYMQGEGKCTVNTYIFENIIRNEILVDDYEIDTVETETEPELVEDKVNFKRTYTRLHTQAVRENILEPKFPVNSIFNPVIKRFPLYGRNPLYAFYLFVLTVIFVLWIISQIICGKALVKITTSIAGKEAGLVLRDMQKGMCIKSKNAKEEQSETKELIYDKLYKDGYLILPESVTFSDLSQIKTIYVKNTLDGDLIVNLNNKIIDNLDSKIVTPEMLVNVLSPTRVILKPDEIGEFEFKIEKSFLDNDQVLEGKYTGKLVFEVIKVRYNRTMVNSVAFTFDVTKEKNATKGKE